MPAFADALWMVLVELAPWLLLGAALAGVLHVALPVGFVERHLRGRGGVLKAVALGVPLPLCSCGVIPAGLGLKKQGASDGASLGFLISTPQTGIDSMLVSASFLGWPFALFKVVSAAVLGLFGGFVADAFSATAPASEMEAPEARRRTVREGVEHAVMLIRSIWAWLLVGVLASAALSTWVPTGSFDSLAAYGGAAALGVVLVLSVPLYVCATASVPIAAALVAGGFPPGAALVFLMAGPATNVATIGAVKKAFGGRVLAIYLGTIVVGSIVAALVFDQLLAVPTAQAAHQHASHGLVSTVSAIALVAAFGWFALDDARGWWSRRRVARDSLEVSVSGLTCNGCVRKLEARLRDEPGVTAVEVTREPGLARVTGGVDRDRLCAIVRDAGFEPDVAA